MYVFTNKRFSVPVQILHMKHIPRFCAIAAWCTFSALWWNFLLLVFSFCFAAALFLMKVGSVAPWGGFLCKCTGADCKWHHMCWKCFRTLLTVKRHFFTSMLLVDLRLHSTLSEITTKQDKIRVTGTTGMFESDLITLISQ